MTLTGHATVLMVTDVPASLAYLSDRLGFDVEGYEGNPLHYGYASRDNVWLHVCCADGARPRPNHEEFPPDMFDAYVRVEDVDALHAELVERGADLLHGPVDQAYGLREIRVRLPDGYVLAFGRLNT
jgi:catechol 2,3-dioxygenase-like lactoylglutathione lyase family enzyme